MTSKKNIFFLCYIYMEDYQGKFQDGKKNKDIIYSNMGYNKYMTEHVKPNKYFYREGRNFLKKDQSIVK